MPIENRGESMERAFRSVLNRLQVEFEADIPDELELLLSIICEERANLTTTQSASDYRLTSVAVKTRQRR
jgi:hypothetical protein